MRARGADGALSDTLARTREAIAPHRRESGREGGGEREGGRVGRGGGGES